MAAQDYLSQYQTFQSSRVKPEDYIKRYSSELGVDKLRSDVAGARGAISATQDVIKATPDSVSGRTSNALVTDAARNRLVQNELQPLNEALSTQSGTYGELKGNLGDVLSDVDKRTGLAISSDDTQANTLMDLYKAAAEKERQEAEQRRWEQEQAEQRRQFDLQLAETRKASAKGSGFAPSLGGGGGNKPPAVMTQKSNGGGFAFATNTGQAVSAAKYAQLVGQDIRDVLYSMGQSGDKYAAQVYNQLRADPFFGKGNAQYDARVKSTYSPLFWGT